MAGWGGTTAEAGGGASAVGPLIKLRVLMNEFVFKPFRRVDFPLSETFRIWSFETEL